MAQTAVTRCTISINGERRLAAQTGKSLLATLADHQVFLPTACGGRGFCGLCRVKVLSGGGPVTERETKRLKEALNEGFRLACQIQVLDDLAIEVSPEILAKGQIQAVCSTIEDLTYDVKRFRFELKDPLELDFVPGQYVQLRCPPYPGNPEGITREYSIASDPLKKDLVDLIIRRVPKGTCTTYCFDHLKVGDDVRLSGPFGDFHLSETDAPMIFVSGGSGMAPFLSILHHMVNIGCRRPATYFFGGKQIKDLYLIDAMRQFEQRQPGFRFIPVVAQVCEGDAWTSQTGLVTEAVKRTFSNLTGYEGYLCGPPGMIDASIQVLTDLGIPQDKIYYDKFA
jgi:Na+-transporting NADH:ubiquinone oxidoreductase subunit F